MDAGLDAPAAVGNVPAGDVQTCVKLNRDDPSEILSNGKQRAYFWKTQASGAPARLGIRQTVGCARL